jgi:predicted acetyltransferase
MGQVEIRRVQGEELIDTYFPLGHYAFDASPPLHSREDLLELLPYREEHTILALFDDGRPMATAALIPMTQTVRGARLAMGGVSAVATDPSGRRRGFARQMLARAFEEMRAAGQAVACLYPFRESFYGRFGYVSFPPRRVAQFAPAGLGSLLRREFDGDLAVGLLKEGVDAYRAFLEAVQPAIHGLALRPAKSFAGANRGDLWLATAVADGRTVGALTYKITEYLGELHASDFLYADSRGKYLLLQWLARHVDQVRRIRLPLRPDDWLETWVEDLEVEITSSFALTGYNEPMGRVVVVEGLAGLATGPGRFAARIVDEHCPWNEGAYAFETVDGHLAVSRANATDCTLSIRGLAALVYGGHDPADFALRGWGEPGPATQATMRIMFPHALPFLHASY